MTTRTRDYLLRKLERRSRAAARKDDVFRAGGAIVWRQDGQFYALRRDMDAGLERCITLSRRHARRISGDLEATRTDLFRRMDEQRYRLADSVAERVDKYHRSVNNSVDKLRVHLRDRLEAIEKILEPMTIQHRAIFELTRAAREPILQEDPNAYQGPEVHAVRQSAGPGDPPGP